MYSILLSSVGAAIGYGYYKMESKDNTQKFNYIAMPSRKALIMGTCVFIGLVAGVSIDTYIIIHKQFNL